MFMAEQLSHTNAEIVYLDFSMESMKISRQRAELRHLTNIAWHNDWIENIPRMGLGKFDLIECSGALHHLADPLAGKIVQSRFNNHVGFY